MADTAALVVALSAQLTKFEKDMDKAFGIADKGVRRIEDRFAKMNVGSGIEDLVSAFTKLAALGGLAAVANSLHAIVEEVARIGEVSERIGITNEQLQGLRFAAASTGASIESIDGGLDRFARNISEAARGSGDLYNVLRVNKVALGDTNTTLLRYADLIKNAKNPQDAMNLAVLAFGRQAGPAFVSILKQGSDGIVDYIAKAREAGTVIDDSFIEKAKELEAQWNTTWLRMKVPVQQFAILFVDTIKRGIAVLIDDIKQLSSFIQAALEAPFSKGDFEARLQELLKQRGAGVFNTELNNPRPQITINKPSGNGSTILPNVQGEDFAKLIQQTERRIQLLDVETETIGKNVGEQERYKTIVDLIYAAKQKGIPLDDARLLKLQEEADKLGDAAQANFEYQKSWQGLNAAAQFAGNELIDIMDGLRNKTLSASDAARQLTNSLIRALEQALLLGQGPLAGIMGLQSNVQGGTGGLIGSLLSAIPKAAGGGSFSAGDLAMVGERGPELVRFGSNATVFPNGASPGGSVVNNFIVENHTDSTIAQSKQSNPSGGNDYRVIIRDAVNQDFASGAYDGAMRGRFKNRPGKVF